MDIQLLNQWIRHPEQLNQDSLYELRTLLARYPFFQAARLLYLKNLFLLHDQRFGEELRKAAIFVPDRKVLFYMIEGENYVIRPEKKEVLQKEEDNADRTLSLINAFLESRSEDVQSQPTELVPDNTAIDYTAYLLNDFEEEGEEHAPLEPVTAEIEEPEPIEQTVVEEQPEPELIEKETVEPLIEETAPVPQEEQPKEVEEIDGEDDEELMDESYFTETLAKIYVKQGRYSKALQIIKKLNLNYPKKNSYFADQIRFLEKLIINAKTNK